MSQIQALTEIPVRKVVEWLTERRQNCYRIAATKTNRKDIEGWLEDASYFDAAIRIIVRTEEPQDGGNG